jgi:hypothetical protein
MQFPRSGDVFLLGPPFSLNGGAEGVVAERMRELVAEASLRGWQAALARFSADVLSGRLREPTTSRLASARAKLAGATWEDSLQDLVDPTRAGWKFLVDLGANDRVLVLGPSSGAIPVTLARNAEHVVVLDGAVERLQLAAHQAGANGLGNLTFACVRDPLRLPLATGSVDLAVVPGLAEWFDAAGGKRTFGTDCGTELLRELRRVVTADGQVYVTALQRHIVARMLFRPRPGTAFSHDELRRAASAAGFASSALFAPIPFRHKFHQVLDLDHAGHMMFSADAYRARGGALRPLIKAWDLCNRASGLQRRLVRQVPAVGAVLSAAPAARTFVERLCDHLSGEPFSGSRLLHYYVRPKGVVVLVLESQAGGWIVRLPLEPRAADTCSRHHRALETMVGDSRLSLELRTLFPKPLAEGRLDGQAYFAESALTGCSGRLYYTKRRRRYDRAVANTAAVLFELRRATERPIRVDEREYVRLCGAWLAELGAIVAPDLRATLEQIEGLLRDRLLGATLPLGWFHGDLDFANLLFAPGDRVSGILDFELFDDRGLPLLDLMVFLSRRAMRGAKLPFGTLFMRTILPRALPPFEARLLDDEMCAAGIDDAMYRAFALCCWLNHLRLRRDSWLVRSPSWLEANLHEVVKQVRSTL